MFNNPLTPVTGPTKSVVDSGPLINPVADNFRVAAQGVNTAQGIIKAVAQAGQKKQAQTRQRQQDQLTLKREQRAQTTFEQGQIDRQQRNSDSQQARDEKQLDLDVSNAVADSEIRIGRSATALRQGVNGSSQASVQLAFEKELTSLRTQFPDSAAAINSKFRDAGLGGFLKGNLNDIQSDHDNKREAQEAADTLAIKTARSDGFQGTDADSIGYGNKLVQLEKEQEANRKLREESRANRTLSVQERASQEKRLEREEKRTGSRYAQTVLGGSLTSTVSLFSGATPQTLGDFQSHVQNELVQLEIKRRDAHEKGNFNPGFVDSVNETFDNHKELLQTFISGDFSHTKLLVDQVKSLEADAEIDFQEAAPNLARLRTASPRAFDDVAKLAVGKELRGKEHTRAFADYLNGTGDPTDTTINTAFNAVQGRNGVEDVLRQNPEELKVQAGWDNSLATLKERELLSSDPNVNPAESSKGLIVSQLNLVAVADRSITSIGSATRANRKEISAISKNLLTPQRLLALEKANSIPSTKIEAEAAINSSRNLASEVVEVTAKQKEVGLSTTFNESSGQVEFSGQPLPHEKLFEDFPGIGGLQRGTRGRSVAFREEATQSLNTALDFLARSKKFDRQLVGNVSDNDYKKAFLSGDFSKIYGTEETPNDGSEP